MSALTNFRKYQIKNLKFQQYQIDDSLFNSDSTYSKIYRYAKNRHNKYVIQIGDNVHYAYKHLNDMVDFTISDRKFRRQRLGENPITITYYLDEVVEPNNFYPDYVTGQDGEIDPSLLHYRKDVFFPTLFEDAAFGLEPTNVFKPGYKHEMRGTMSYMCTYLPRLHYQYNANIIVGQEGFTGSIASIDETTKLFMITGLIIKYQDDLRRIE